MSVVVSQSGLMLPSTDLELLLIGRHPTSEGIRVPIELSLIRAGLKSLQSFGLLLFEVLMPTSSAVMNAQDRSSCYVDPQPNRPP